jgi:NADH-quinone oxidoreductase subunit N
MENLASFRYFVPETILAVATLAVLTVDLVWKERRRLLTTIFLVAALGALVALLEGPKGTSGIFHGLVAFDLFSAFFKVLFVATAVLAVLFTLDAEEGRDIHYAEYLAMILTTTFGAMLLASSTHLLMVFLGIELVSIPCYVLAGYLKHSQRSSEASLKYVIYGAASSGLMIYGISLLYGVTGSLDFAAIRDGLTEGAGHPFLVRVSLLFFMAGLGYKIAVFPFHQWSPDVYEGAPTPVTAFLSVGPKAAGFAVVLRLFLSAFSRTEGTSYLDVTSVDWPMLLALISAATMTVGNLLAIHQKNLKRLLAYSSIAHAGYMLMGPVALSGRGLEAVLFYLAVYLMMNLGAFLVVIAVHNHTRSESIEDVQGLAWTPGLGALAAVTMAIFLFSLTGLPPFGGFVGKFYLFAAVIEGKRFLWLALVAVANSVVSLYYYARIVKAMFLAGHSPDQPPRLPRFTLRPMTATLLVVLAVGVTLSGLFWNRLAQWVDASSQAFLR